jgi:hypothetical protein
MKSQNLGGALIPTTAVILAEVKLKLCIDEGPDPNP